MMKHLSAIARPASIRNITLLSLILLCLVPPYDAIEINADADADAHTSSSSLRKLTTTASASASGSGSASAARSRMLLGGTFGNDIGNENKDIEKENDGDTNGYGYYYDYGGNPHIINATNGNDMENEHGEEDMLRGQEDFSSPPSVGYDDYRFDDVVDDDDDDDNMTISPSSSPSSSTSSSFSLWPSSSRSSSPSISPSVTFSTSPTQQLATSSPNPTLSFSSPPSTSPSSTPSKQLSFIEREKLKAAKDEEDLIYIVHDPVARTMAALFAIISIVGMLVTAQQLLERPDGLCANCCRLSLKAATLCMKMCCIPCSYFCGYKPSGYTGTDQTNRAVFLQAEEYTDDLELT